MGYEAKKTEHAGSKKGCGAYWGRKADAKKQSNRSRREKNKVAIQNKENTDNPRHPECKEE